MTEGTTNPTLIPPTTGRSSRRRAPNLTYGDENGQQRQPATPKHTLSTPVVLEPVAEGHGRRCRRTAGRRRQYDADSRELLGNYYNGNPWAWAENRDRKGAYLALKVKVFEKSLRKIRTTAGVQIFPIASEGDMELRTTTAVQGRRHRQQGRALRSGSRATTTSIAWNFHRRKASANTIPESRKGGDDILGDYIWFTVTRR